MADALWEFWIDVGGTFTDCLAKAPDGSIRRHKLLSSSVTKGRVSAGSTRASVVDPARCNEPAAVWNGWQLVVVDYDGSAVDSGFVTGFDPKNGRLAVEGLAESPAVGSNYELHSHEESPVVAIRHLLGLSSADPIPPVQLRLGTTRGTNALITRTGARTALVTTRGFGDVLEIGYQTRPKLFDLTIRKPPALTTTCVEIDERVSNDQAVLVEPNESEIHRQLTTVFEAGTESLAICLLQGHRFQKHERLIAQIAREIGFREISASYETAPFSGFVPRAQTTAVNAYLAPVLRGYLANIAHSLPKSLLRILTSAGGLVSPQAFRGTDSILSGPAGGVVGFSRIAQAAGFSRAIGFDMGGTSTDVSRFDGKFELEYETEKAGVKMIAPMLAIETVAAGGGSICRFDGVKLVVGPASAGADPGPACYGRGGPLTVTDANLFLGRIDAERFPFPLDGQATRRRLEELATEIANASDREIELVDLAAGVLRIANANMAAAIRRVTVAKGANPADYVLVAFGGAGPQHACAVARELGIRQVLIHPEAGVLSALGIGIAEVVRHRSCEIGLVLNAESLALCRDRLTELEHEATLAVVDEGVQGVEVRFALQLRYQGVDSYLTIEWPENDDFAAAFAAAHLQRYGYNHANRPLEIVAANVEVAGHVSNSLAASTRKPARAPVERRSSVAWFDGKQLAVPLYERAKLVAGDHFDGPAIIAENIATTVIETGWALDVLSQGELLLTDNNIATSGAASPAGVAESADPIFLEIFNNSLVNIAEQMGVTLRNTASSVNVKERLDFSCAIFTSDGRLVANAPHVPVHLGAMEETVRATIASNPCLQPGDVIATNNPYEGGSHLPDVTVITPVHDPASGELRFFTASRAHHAEIGGIAPGSMPATSTNLAEEGVLIRNLKIVEAGESRLDDLRTLLTSSPYPSRDVDTNLADVVAQLAANCQGANDLLALAKRLTWPLVERYLEYVQDAAEAKVRQALKQFSVGTHAFTDHLETFEGQSTPICVTLTIHKADAKRAATIDFTGTGPTVKGNLNANRAIVTAAVIYTLRTLVDEDIPLNHGVLRPVEIVLPSCLLNPMPGELPETTPAVAGGNVETSQRVVDVLLGAIGVAGASQGTMNNVILGDATFGYYETICGGSGATAYGPGANAVQVHMTNTRITDPEIMEHRYPVRVQEFSIRRGSGGNGYHRGGDGIVRRLEFLRPLKLSLLTQRRGPHPPYGAGGGEPGAAGINWLIRADGSEIQLGGIAQLDVARGDILIVETPGGGGFGQGT